MGRRLAGRIERIEQRLGMEKGVCLRFPDGKGGFVEVPGCRTVVDVLARAQIRKNTAEVNETERK